MDDHDDDAPLSLTARLREKSLSLQCEALAAENNGEPHLAAGFATTARFMSELADRIDARRV